MTPQDKAKELVEKLGKEHALIAVEELIELAKKADAAMNPIWKTLYKEPEWSQVYYWKQVKAEIAIESQIQSYE